ncbi:hypothetical protein KI387_005722, partial [Taxus chinensis]
SIEDTIPDAQLFRLNYAPIELEDITVFLHTKRVSKGMKTLQKKHIVIRMTPYQLIGGDLYKLGCDDILHQRVLDHERKDIMEEAQGGITGGHYAGDSTTHKILMVGIFREIFYKDSNEYVKLCDHFQCLGNPRHRDEMSLQPIASTEPFEKWLINFVGPISPPVHRTNANYIITCTNYLK